MAIAGQARGKYGIEFRGMAELMGKLSPRDVPDQIEGEVRFNTPYALAQHERLDYQHKEGRKAKYLEGPLKENADQYAEHLGSRLRGALRGPGPGNIGEIVAAAARRGMIEVTENLLSDAQKIVPHDEGTLEATGTATVYVDGRRVSGQAGQGQAGSAT